MLLNAVGDIVLSRKVGEILVQKGWKFPFEHIAQTLKQADIIIGCPAGPLSSRGRPNPSKPQGSPHFRIDPRAIGGLKYAGFNVLVLANNHILDYGEVALLDTLELLEQEGIMYVGAGRNEAEARRPIIVESQGLKVALLAYTYTYPATSKRPGAALIREKNIKADVHKAKALADTVVVSLHHGIEYSDYPLPAHISLAHKIVDWGAHLVLGHHPHVLQGIEHYKDGVIAYSLGNFVIDLSDPEVRKKAMSDCLLAKTGKISFDPERDTRPMESIIFQCRLDKGGVSDIRLIPIYINQDFQPVVLDDRKGQDILSRVEISSLNLKNENLPIWRMLSDAYSQEYVSAAIGKGLLWNLRRLHKLRRSHLSLIRSYLSSKLLRR